MWKPPVQFYVLLQPIRIWIPGKVPRFISQRNGQSNDGQNLGLGGLQIQQITNSLKKELNFYPCGNNRFSRWNSLFALLDKYVRNRGKKAFSSSVLASRKKLPQDHFSSSWLCSLHSFPLHKLQPIILHVWTILLNRDTQNWCKLSSLPHLTWSLPCSTFK